MTVCNKGFNRRVGACTFFPIIQLCGKWLRDAGFKGGHTIDITCKNDKIIIPNRKYNGSIKCEYKVLAKNVTGRNASILYPPGNRCN